MQSKKPQIPFEGFDEHNAVRIYESGLLPHWRQEGCTYFVTFRLADSIPKQVLVEIEEQHRNWLAHRGIDANSADWKRQLAKLSTSEQRVYEGQVGHSLNVALDLCHGSCCLKDERVSQQVASALDFFHDVRVLTGDFVVMPNHVHALMTPLPGHELEDILHSIKSFTANQINRLLESSGTLWQRDNYDHIVRDAEQLFAYQQYIAINPEKAFLRSGDYIHSRVEYAFS
jgi:putative transposase